MIPQEFEKNNCSWRLPVLVLYQRTAGFSQARHILFFYSDEEKFGACQASQNAIKRWWWSQRSGLVWRGEKLAALHIPESLNLAEISKSLKMFSSPVFNRRAKVRVENAFTKTGIVNAVGPVVWLENVCFEFNTS